MKPHFRLNEFADATLQVDDAVRRLATVATTVRDGMEHVNILNARMRGLELSLEAARLRIADIECFIGDLMKAHGPGTLASDELFARGVALVERIVTAPSPNPQTGSQHVPATSRDVDTPPDGRSD